jgi:uncharacterized protein YneF (UPF0154 family)
MVNKRTKIKRKLVFIGLVNVKTFKTAMMTMGEPLSEDEMNEMMKDLSIDEDG